MTADRKTPAEEVEPLDDAALESVSGGMSGIEEAGVIGAAVGVVAVGVFVAPAVVAEGVGVIANSATAAIFGGGAAAGGAVGAGGDAIAKGAEEGYDWLKSKL